MKRTDPASIAQRENQIKNTFKNIINCIDNAMKAYNDTKNNDCELDELETSIVMAKAIINDKVYGGNYQSLLQDLTKKFMIKQTEYTTFAKNYGYTNERFEYDINNFVKILCEASSRTASNIPEHNPAPFVEEKSCEV